MPRDRLGVYRARPFPTTTSARARHTTPNREVDFVARTLTSSRHRAAYRNSYDMAFSLVSTVAFSAAATAPGRRVSSKRDVAMRAAKGFEMPKQYKKVSFLP